MAIVAMGEKEDTHIAPNERVAELTGNAGT